MNLFASMRYLVALHEHRHFGRAAQACHITQPALSNAMRALEGELGVVIVKRGRTYAGLTPEGERVLASAQRIVHEHTVLQQELASEVGQPRGALRMGAVPTAMPILARFAAMLQARHRCITPVVLSMSSGALEAGLEDLSLDLALGYTDRPECRRLVCWPQYTERYFLLGRTDVPGQQGLHIGPQMPWDEAARLPLCLLTPDMHNRSLVDSAFAQAGVQVQPVMQTNSVLTLALSVVAGTVCSVLPGALVDAVRGYGALQARPLVGPDLCTPIGFMTHATAQPSRVLEAALVWAQDAQWQSHVTGHSGLLRA